MTLLIAGFGIVPSLIPWIFVFILVTLPCGFVSNVIDEVIEGLDSKKLGEKDLFRPNEKIWRSMHNSILAGLTFGLVGGLLFALLWLPMFWITAGSADKIVLLTALFLALPGGIICGMSAALLNGGTATLQHGVLRFLFQSINATPKTLPIFSTTPTRMSCCARLEVGTLSYISSCLSTLQGWRNRPCISLQNAA